MVILIEESTTEIISPLLEAFIKRVTSVNKTPDSIQKDCLLSLLIVSMIENGFVLVDDDCEILDTNSINEAQVYKWKSSTGVYEVPMILNDFHTPIIKLILSPLGAMALVNVIIKDLEAETYSVCLPISKYVVAPLANTIPKIFRELKQFSLIFKNKVLSPVKSRVLGHFGYASASLVGLPEELLFNVMLYLPLSDVVNVAQTCSRLGVMLKSGRFWHDILKRDFKIGRDLPLTGEFDWFNIYKCSYIIQRDKALAQRRAAGTMHDYMEHSDYISYIDNPMWNVLL